MSAASALPALDDTLGAILIGAACATLLLGIATLQAFNYFQNSGEHDPPLLRGAVGCVYFMEVAHSIVIWHTTYSLTVTFYAQPQHLANPPHSLELNVVFACLIELIVAVYYSHRIRILSRSSLIPGICVFLAVGRTLVGIAMVPIFWLGTGFGEFRTNQSLRALVLTLYTVGPAVDTLLACTLCYHLAVARQKTFSGTKQLLRTLMKWAIESMLLTSLISILQLVLFVTMEDNVIWIIFYLCEAKRKPFFYVSAQTDSTHLPAVASNSLFAQLNGREKLRGNGNSVHVIEELERGHNQSGVVIRMHTMTDTQKDLEMDCASSGEGGRRVKS
ncbi:Saposin B-type domain-containing protein [Mycena kentingensis (nom. inval.)]|nr:Saposin B-type domain-containing protein [Mycena kentingensis (nom. inval.)]